MSTRPWNLSWMPALGAGMMTMMKSMAEWETPGEDARHLHLPPAAVMPPSRMSATAGISRDRPEEAGLMLSPCSSG